MLTLLRSLIKPRPDYCSQLWSPRDQYSINKLEDVQKQFLSQIRDSVMDKMTYLEKLSEMRAVPDLLPVEAVPRAGGRLHHWLAMEWEEGKAGHPHLPLCTS
jgi:hypothetical protein